MAAGRIDVDRCESMWMSCDDTILIGVCFDADGGPGEDEQPGENEQLGENSLVSTKFARKASANDETQRPIK